MAMVKTITKVNDNRLSLVLRDSLVSRLGPTARLGSWQVGIRAGRVKGFVGPRSEEISLAFDGALGVSQAEGQPRLGPVVAILTIRQNQSATRPFGAQTSMLRGFIRAGNKLGSLVYVITPQEISSSDHVWGWFPCGGQWQMGRFPHPDVVYDRIPTRQAERLSEVRRAKRHWQQRQASSYFGVDFFDKWQVHRAWSDSEIKRHIPDTMLYQGIQTLMTMLQRFSMVYIKPCSSSLGLGIARIEGGQHGPWLISWRQPDGHRRDDMAKTRAELGRKTDALIKGRDYLVQQGIELIAYQNRLFDIRFAVQRDNSGEWRHTGEAARVGFAKSIVTNMAAGAVAHSVDPIYRELSKTLHQAPDDIHRSLAEVALAAAKALGRSFGARLGEVGLDLAIDQTGEIWILEANSKPLRTVFQELTDKRAAHLCLQRPMEYARYLAGFHPDTELLTGLGKRGESID